MKVFIYFIGGIFIVLLQTSKFLKILGINYLPDFILIYLILLATYSVFHPVVLIYMGMVFGVLMDIFAGSLVLNSIIYPIAIIIFMMFRKKFLEFNLLLKFLVFFTVNITYVLLNHLIMYAYSGYFFSFSSKDAYIILNNILIYYLFYLIRTYLNEKNL